MAMVLVHAMRRSHHRELKEAWRRWVSLSLAAMWEAVMLGDAAATLPPGGELVPSERS